MGREANPKSFRQAIIKKYEQCKDVEETMKYFKAEGTNREIVIIWTLRGIGVDI